MIYKEKIQKCLLRANDFDKDFVFCFKFFLQII